MNRQSLCVCAVIMACLIMAGTSRAQHIRIFACAIANDSAAAFMGGSSNGSGLYQSDDTGRTWKHLGWNNVKCYSMDMDRSSNGRILYLACGNGVMRSTDFGTSWTVMTDWRIAEVMDVAVNPKEPNEIYCATAHGSIRSRDAGKSWKQLSFGLQVPYCSRIMIDSIEDNHVLLAAESGLYALKNDTVWVPVPIDVRNEQHQTVGSAKSIRAIVEVTRSFWAAASENAGLCVSKDSGRHFWAFPDARDSLWNIAVLGIDPWNAEYDGSGPEGEVWMEHSFDRFSNPGYRGPYRNVTSWIRIRQSEADFNRTQFPYVSLRSTLGHGLYGVPGRLGSLQIWTLKAFEIQ